MMNVPTPTGLLAPILLGLTCAVFAQPPSSADADLGGTSWQLVRFLGGDGKVLNPDNPSKYAVDFAAGGTVSARIDCNRGHGAWSSAGPNQVQFGPMALTRAMCPPAPITDKLTADWSFVRSYTLKDGHLFLSLMADGGTYEFAPVGGQNVPAAAQPGDAALSGLPATFTGTMPCADCPGIDYRLDLNSDHTYSSKMTYRERQATLSDDGQWELAGTTLTLHSGKGSIEKYAIRDADTLRKLDVNGQEIVSQFNYDLKRQGALSTDQAATAPGEAAAGSDFPLEGTRWILVRLGENPVSADAGPNAAFLQFDGASHRVSGADGCNRLVGSYELNGSSLVFSKMAGTMMACVKGMDTEQAFKQALGQAATYGIAGRNLILFDSAGRPLATLEAHPGD